jgi:hypothetical protein
MDLLTRDERSEMLRQAKIAADFCLDLAESHAARTGKPFKIGQSFGICIRCATHTEITLSTNETADCPLTDQCGGENTVKHPVNIAANS